MRKHWFVSQRMEIQLNIFLRSEKHSCSCFNANGWIGFEVQICKGVFGYKIDELPNLDEVLPLINNILAVKHSLHEGDKYVFVSVTISSVGDKNSNMFTIQSLSN